MKHNFQNTATILYQLKHIKCNDSVSALQYLHYTCTLLQSKHSLELHRLQLLYNVVRCSVKRLRI